MIDEVAREADGEADSWHAIGRPVVHVVAAGLIGAIIGSLDGVLAAGATDLQPLTAGAKQAAIGLALALVLPLALVCGGAVGACTWLATRLTSAEGLVKLLRRGWFRGILALVGVGAGGGMAYLLRRKEIDWQAVDWALPLMVLASLGGYALLVWVFRETRLRRLVVFLVALVGLFAASVLAYTSGGDARAAALTRVSDGTAMATMVLKRVVPLFDRDEDGFPTALCAAGCDCDDTNPAINPSAADVPGNGVDEDCSGDDASLQAAAEYAAIFAKPGSARASGDVGSTPTDGASRRVPNTRLSLPGPTRAPFSNILPAVPGGGPPPRVEPGQGDRSKPPPGASRAPPGAAPSAKRRTPVRRPNILMVTIDTLRADHLGVYGYARKTSPNIDAWARQAVVFDQARTTGPSTRFSVAPTLLSKWFTEIKRGKYEWPVLSDDETFLAERLKAFGYTTAAFHSIRYFRKQYGFTQGFDHYSVEALDKRGPPLKMISSDFITDEVLEYFDATLSRTNEPWFVWAYYGDPHSAYMFHKEVPKFGPLYRDTYDNEIAFVDKHLGRLFAGLRTRGQWENTVVVLWSDHGEGLDPKEDHGTKYHSKNLYDELVRVPLIISGPGIKPRRVPTAVSMIDVTPTLIDWLGAPLDPEFRGVSLVPYLMGETPSHPPTFAEKHRKKDNPQKSMVMWPHKVVIHFPQMHVEIYDLERDPKELDNIESSMDAAVKKRLIGVFKHWLGNVLEPQTPNWRH